MAPVSVWRGVGLILLAGLCFTIQDALAKHAAATVPVLMVLMVRYVLQAGISAALLLPALPRERLRSRRIGLQLLRGLLLLGASTSAVFGLKHLPMAEFAAIVMVTPLLVSLLAVVFYNERLGGAGWVLLLLSFAGTLLIVRPTGTPYGWAALYPFACMVLGALYQIVTSRLAHAGEDPTATHLLSMAVCALLFSLTAPLSWSPVDSMASWGWLALMSATGAAGHLFVAHAYRYAPATVLAPYTYGSLGWAVLAGWLVFGQIPDGWTWTGIALILGCGLASTRLRQGGR
jgi:drug/metabolite transporter (DMT)-like permease